MVPLATFAFAALALGRLSAAAFCRLFGGLPPSNKTCISDSVEGRWTVRLCMRHGEGQAVPASQRIWSHLIAPLRSGPCRHRTRSEIGGCRILCMIMIGFRLGAASRNFRLN